MQYIYNTQNITTRAFKHENGTNFLRDWILELDTQEKRAEFGISEELDPVEAPYVPTVEELIKQATEAVKHALQAAIDEKAQAFGFSSGNGLMLYAGFTNPFQPLAQQFATWEASVWVEAGAYKDEVLQGLKPMLSGEQAVALMPDYPL